MPFLQGRSSPGSGHVGVRAAHVDVHPSLIVGVGFRVAVDI